MNAPTFAALHQSLARTLMMIDMMADYDPRTVPGREQARAMVTALRQGRPVKPADVYHRVTDNPAGPAEALREFPEGMR